MTPHRALQAVERAALAWSNGAEWGRGQQVRLALKILSRLVHQPRRRATRRAPRQSPRAPVATPAPFCGQQSAAQPVQTPLPFA